MAIRTIRSPGVEITERDLSQYADAAVGTAVLVTGFASKGRDYEPVYLTSRSSWLQQFGEPTNEAERYFFNACMEVVNQGGMLYACKLPYKNESLNKLVAKTYTVNVSKLQQLSTVAEYVAENDLDDVLAGDLTRFGVLNVHQDEPGLSAFFQMEDTAKTIDAFVEAVGLYNQAIPYAYAEPGWLGVANIQTREDDNWSLAQVKSIYDRLSALFNDGTPFWTAVRANGGISCEASGETFVVNNLAQLSIDRFGFEPSMNPEQCIEHFVDLVKEAFGNVNTSYFIRKVCDPSVGLGLSGVVAQYPEFTESTLYKFYEANAPFFEALAEIDFETDVQNYNGLIPYTYCTNDKFNLATYYLAYRDYQKIKEAVEVIDNTNLIEIVNKTIVVDNYFGNLPSELSTAFDFSLEAVGEPPSGMVDENISSLVGDETIHGWLDVPAADEYLTNHLVSAETEKDMPPINKLQEAYMSLFDNEAYKELKSKAMEGQYIPTDFAPFAVAYYLDNVNVFNPVDRKTLRDSKSLNVFLSGVAEDDDPTSDISALNFFQRYNGPNSNSPELSSIPAVVDGAVQTLTYDKFYDFAKSFTATSAYEQISAYAYEHEDDMPSLKKTVDALQLSAISSDLAYSEIKKADPTVDQYLTINSDAEVELVDLETVDGYATGETPVRTNKIVIVDKTRGTLGTSFAKDQNGVQKELVGVIPVVTTAANALYVQALLETGDSGISRYNAVKTAKTLSEMDNDGILVGPYEISDEDAAIPFMSDNAGTYTVSQLAASSFPSIHFDSDGHMDRQNLKKIGVVVLRAFLDPGDGNKVNYDVVEAYAGELDKNAVDPNTGASTFIDNLVNAQSEYIELYSNCFNQTATRDMYSKMDIFVIPPQTAGDLGFYQFMTKKNVSLSDSILKALPLVWEKNEDINEKQIDIVCDAGVSNIAQFIKSCYNGRAGEYDPSSEAAALFKLRNKEDTSTWRAVLDMYDNFCKNIRKDCMFVADGPRPFCLTGNKKIVRPSKPSNTVDATILPMLKFITGVNTNYGAGYCDWFQKADEFSGDEFWCPPSIQAMGVYLNTDINFDYWMAPAGLNRGRVAALDVAFNPTQRQSDEIYPKCWNYARNYPNDGIVLEGQRTFQTKPSALDRVNVRRAVLRFERMTYETARWFVYENNTTYTRQRFYDALDGMFKEVKGQGGLIDYKIICDESINTPEIIDRNELRVKIGVKVPKCAEFIMIEFNILRQGGSWTEML